MRAGSRGSGGRRTGWLALLLAGAALAGCGRDEPPLPSGTLEVTTVDVAPLLTARVLAVGAQEGQLVAAGDTLLWLDTESQRLERRQALARLQRLEAERGQAEQGRRQSARQLAHLEQTLERTRALLAQGSATEQQVDDLEAQRDVTASQLRAAGDRLLALAAEGEELAAAIALQERRIRDGVVLAPRRGSVLVRAAEPGEVARAGVAALRLADLDTLELRVYLAGPDLDLVRLGQRLPVVVDALDDRELTGTVSWISPDAEFTPKNVQTRQARAQLVYAVELRVPNAGDLHVGMPASVRLREEAR